MNLLSNAISPAAAARCIVAIEPVDGHLRIAVRDEGAGPTPQQQARLFQHFERLGAETSGVPGTGLGLVITRELAQATGAALQVRSTPGSGSTLQHRAVALRGGRGRGTDGRDPTAAELAPARAA